MRKAGITLQELKDSAAGKLPANAHLFAEKKAKRSKYNSSKSEWEGLVFDSKKEYSRYRELLLMMKHGHIGQLERQVSYELIPASETEKATYYIADHRYVDMATGLQIVEDVKSEMTRKLPVYIMKRKLMLERHGITIKEF